MLLSRARRFLVTATILAASAATILAQHPATDSGGDVLTPGRRGVERSIMVGLRMGLNRSAYSNDRYLDNSPFDIGQTNGETDVYSAAAGFGFSTGIDVEYPLNSAVSIVGVLQFDRVSFSSSGTVAEPCILRDSSQAIGTSLHEFSVRMDFLRLGVAAKLDVGSWYLLAGLAGAHPLATTLERTRTFGSTDWFYPGTDGRNNIEETGVVPNPRRVHYALRLGGGLNYQLSSRLRFSPELVFDFGMNAVNKSPNSDLGVYGLLATLHYALR